MSIHQHSVSAVAIEDTEFVVLSKHALHQRHREDAGPGDWMVFCASVKKR